MRMQIKFYGLLEVSLDKFSDRLTEKRKRKFRQGEEVVSIDGVHVDLNGAGGYEELDL